MLWIAAITTLLESFGFGPQPVACSFPAIKGDETAIEVVMHPRPSLKDLPGLYRVEMAVNGDLRLPAAAQPLATTPSRGILVRGVMDASVFYTVGFDANGAAALNVMWANATEEGPPREITRTGRCTNYERIMDRWLSE